MAEQKRVVIVGGGVAGISAAVHAIQNGVKPILLERSPGLGGRARSLFANDVNAYIDNGQHALSGSYAETRRLLSIIGSEEKIDFQQRLSIQFQLNARHSIRFQSWPLPPPLHFLLPLLLNAPLTAIDRRFLKCFGWRYLRTTGEDLRRFTVREWLNAAGDAPFLEKFLWEPITLATLNTPLEKASAFLLYQVLKNAFLGTAKNCGLGLPNEMLGDLFAGPAEKYMKKHGGEIRTNASVTRIILENKRIVALEMRNGERIETPMLIMAIPPHALAKLLDASPEIREKLPYNFHKFEYSPIITANIWCKNPISAHFPTALVDSPVQWVFSLPTKAQKPGLHGYALVISAAFKEVDFTAEQILQLIDSELYHYFLKNLFNDLQVAHYKIVKEKRATFLQTPQSLHLRATAKTPIPNFFLAGDWTDTDLPATIESAALSGRLAAEHLIA